MRWPAVSTCMKTGWSSVVRSRVPLKSFRILQWYWITLVLISDTSGYEVARFDRPFKCTCCPGMPCSLQNMEITTSSFTIGQIKQKCHCYPVFQVCDSNENVTLEIKGPVCPISCFGNVDFEVILHPVDSSGLNRGTL